MNIESKWEGGETCPISLLSGASSPLLCKRWGAALGKGGTSHCRGADNGFAQGSGMQGTLARLGGRGRDRAGCREVFCTCVRPRWKWTFLLPSSYSSFLFFLLLLFLEVFLLTIPQRWWKKLFKGQKQRGKSFLVLLSYQNLNIFWR